MNWKHYQTLVNYLKQLPPEQFDYGSENEKSCGCVAHHVQKLIGNKVNREEVNGPITIEDYLDVSTNEACYLYGEKGFVEDGCESFYYPNPNRFGASGIAEALRRLAFVAERHIRKDEMYRRVWHRGQHDNKDGSKLD